ncbi:hypothetical protein [Lentzea cavernae]|uniref:hypothetical protein n=1 Tax=Lentzea cavernae TaxID=2020703 RepID=UPI00174BFE72|nr:hypothetical protein [Lentzea cavernae]
MLKSTAKAVLRNGDLMIIDGASEYRCVVANPVNDAVEALNGREFRRSAMAEALATLRDSDLGAGEEAVSALVKAGLVVEHPEGGRAYFNAEYIGYRLIDAHRRWAPRLWNDNPLIRALRSGGRRDLGIGLMVETFFVVRAAHWTAPSVLAHDLTARQRSALREFFDEEADHSDLMARDFVHVGIEPAKLKAAQATPESTLFNNYFFAMGHQSVAHFAASLIIPEVPEYVLDSSGVKEDSDGKPRDVLDLLEFYNDIPAAALAGFRAHGAIDEGAEHAMMPVLVLAEEGVISAERTRVLASVVAQGIMAYDHFLHGINRRYDGWDGHLVLGPVLGEF